MQVIYNYKSCLPKTHLRYLETGKQIRTFANRKVICRSRTATWSFAKSNVAVREEQRGRSRTVNKNDKPKQEKLSVITFNLLTKRDA